MLHTIVFIHGTGVREPVYTALFSLVQQALSFRLGAPRIHLEPCYWGGNCGSKLFLDGASVPEADTTRAIDGEEDEADYHLALWGLLHRDPFAELDLLALRQPNGEPPPGREPPGYELYQLVQTLTIEPDELEPDQKQKLASLFATADLGSHFEVARAEVAEKYREVIEAATEPLGQCRVAIARAIVARSAQLYREVNDVPDGYLTLTGTLCDRVVDLLVAALGGQERDVGNWVEERAGRLIKHVATGWFRRRRGRYSEHFAPFGADIVIYQTRRARSAISSVMRCRRPVPPRKRVERPAS